MIAPTLDKSKALHSSASEKKSILPFSTEIIELDIPDDLDLGTYWAEITVFLEGGWVVGKQVLKFNVVEPGTLPAEELPVFKEEAIPLAMSWAIIIMWVLVLVFVAWKISKIKYKKKK